MSDGRVCADCGCGLRKNLFTAEESVCYDCKCRLMSEVNTPAMDKAVSVFLFVGLLIALAWMIF